MKARATQFMVTLHEVHGLMKLEPEEIRLNLDDYAAVSWLCTPVAAEYTNKQGSFHYLGTTFIRDDSAPNKFA